MRLLLLAGSGEGRRIAAALADLDGVTAVASLAGSTARPKDLALPTRHGGFGGDAGFQDYLIQHGIAAVLDATHPFAARISERSARICKTLGIPYAQVMRPAWVAQNGDDWRFFDRAQEVAGFVAPGSTVFLGTGRQGLENYANLQGCRVICRRIDPPQNSFPFPGGDYLVGRPPFPLADEIALFQDLKVDWLVVKNSGGDASRSKLDAARALNIKVALQNRPKALECLQFSSETAAVAWVESLL